MRKSAQATKGSYSAMQLQSVTTGCLHAREIRDILYAYALEHPETFGVDLKTQVTIDYGSKENFDHCRPLRITHIVAAISHSTQP